MAKADNSGIRTAKKTVSRWFCGDGTRRFLPLAGPAIVVSQAEERAILAAAEPFIAGRYDRLNGQLSLGILSMVAVPMLHYGFGDRVLGAFSPSAGMVGVATFTVGGLLMLLAAWRYERSLFDLRDAVALALREKEAGATLQPIMPGAREPDIRKLGLIAFSLTGLFLLWPLAGALWKQFQPSSGVAGWTLEAAAGLAAGPVLGILAFAMVWALWLRPASASSEDRTP